MFNLSARIAEHPINDQPYVRHLRSADIFNELQDARFAAFKALAAVNAAMKAHEDAMTRYEAAQAKAELMETMEAL